MSMKLYFHPLSPFARRVRIQLLEKHLEADEILVRLEEGEHTGEAFRAINPYGRVPTLVDDDFVLYESSAILEYLEQLRPTPRLLPESARERARCAMHIKLCDLEVGIHAPKLLFPRRFEPAASWDVEAQRRVQQSINRHFEILARSLGDREYLVGEAFSLADLAYYIITPFIKLCELTPPANIMAWAERLESRPSARVTFPAR